MTVSHHKSTWKSTSRCEGFTLVELLVVLAVIVLLVAFLLPAQRTTREPARRAVCKNQLRQIALALHHYELSFKALPPVYTVDAEGKPLHSWRTLILPYLEQQSLYDQLDLTKPWDDPANAAAFQTPVTAFHCPSANCPADHTTYLAVVAQNSCFRVAEPRLRSDISRNHSNVLMVIETNAEHAVPWMCPRDADEALVLSLGSSNKPAHPSGMNAVFLDGSVQYLPGSLTADKRRALISIEGKDVDF